MTVNKNTEDLIKDLFRVCDKWLDIQDFVLFEKEFSEVTKQYGYDLHKIYYGKTFEEVKALYKRYEILNDTTENPEQDQ